MCLSMDSLAAGRAVGGYRFFVTGACLSRQVDLEASTHFWTYQSTFLPGFQGVDKPCYKLFKLWTELPHSHAISSLIVSITGYSGPRCTSLLLGRFRQVTVIKVLLTILKVCWETRSYHFTVSFVLEFLPCCDQPLVQYDDAMVA